MLCITSSYDNFYTMHYYLATYNLSYAPLIARARIHTCLQVITVCFGVCTFLCLFEARALMYPCGVMLMSFIGLRVLPVDHVGFLSSLIVVAFQLFMLVIGDHVSYD